MITYTLIDDNEKFWYDHQVKNVAELNNYFSLGDIYENLMDKSNGIPTFSYKEYSRTQTPSIFGNKDIMIYNK